MLPQMAIQQKPMQRSSRPLFLEAARRKIEFLITYSQLRFHEAHDEELYLASNCQTTMSTTTIDAAAILSYYVN